MTGLRKEQSEFIESFAFLDSSLPRSWGRILGYLLICEPSRRSAQQIQEELSLSAGTVSTALSVLVSTRLVHRISVLGDRKFYFEISDDGWKKGVEQRIVLVHRLKELAQNGLNIAPHNERLKEMHRVYDTLGKEFDRILDKL